MPKRETPEQSMVSGFGVDGCAFFISVFEEKSRLKNNSFEMDSFQVVSGDFLKCA